MSKPNIKEQLQNNYGNLLKGWGVSESAKKEFIAQHENNTVTENNTVSKINTVNNTNTPSNNDTVKNINTVSKKDTVKHIKTVSNIKTASNIATVSNFNTVLKGNTRIVFDYLKSKSENEQTELIGYHQIAHACNINRMTVKNSISKLILSGLIARIETKNNVENKGTVYKFNTVLN